jgi:uncharacterized protein (TIGR03118 family)
MRWRVLLAALTALTLLPAVSRADAFGVTPLVADQASTSQNLGFGSPQRVDPATPPNLVNPWGISASATSPFWVSNNATGTSTLYSVNAAGVVTQAGLVVSMPDNMPNANPPSFAPITGQVNTGTVGGNYNGNAFLFAAESGAIYGWRGALGTVAETLKPQSNPNTGDVYKGLALSGSTLIAANFRTGALDTFSGTTGGKLGPAASFTDPTIPAGFAPFNVQTLSNGKTYVTFAMQDSFKHDDVAGPGNGFVDIYNPATHTFTRLVSNGPLNSPWGLAIAPAGFHQFGGDLLVGNFGDGEINAFDPNTGAFLGTLLGADGRPISIDGLWALAFGNGGSVAQSNRLFFTAGPNGESNGLFGAVDPVPEPTSAALFLVAGAGLLLLRRRKARAA